MAVSKKFSQIEATAHELFWRHGIKRVSIEEICQTAGVSKMTFYKYFANKSELAIHVIRRAIDQAKDRYLGIMQQDIPFSEKVEMIIQMKMDQAQDISEEIIRDLWHNPNPEIASLMEETRKQNFKLFIEDLVKAQKNGEIRQNLKPEFILYFLNHMIELMDDEKLTSLYDSTQTMVEELVNFFFYGIFSGDK